VGAVEATMNHQDRVRRNYSTVAETIVERADTTESVPTYRCLQCDEELVSIPEAIEHSNETGHAIAVRMQTHNRKPLGIVANI
jgi:hypothetical protein